MEVGDARRRGGHKLREELHEYDHLHGTLFVDHLKSEKVSLSPLNKKSRFCSIANTRDVFAFKYIITDSL